MKILLCFLKVALTYLLALQTAYADEFERDHKEWNVEEYNFMDGEGRLVRYFSNGDVVDYMYDRHRGDPACRYGAWQRVASGAGAC